LFVCVRNAGRSQMAAALLAHHAGDRISVRSAGSDPGDAVHANVVEAMAEIGIDLSDVVPRRLDERDLTSADVVVTMGCGDACPVVPATRYVDWDLDDPADRGLDEVRATRDEIERRVVALRDELLR
jgi:protein-tyrosine-phosphatase